MFVPIFDERCRIFYTNVSQHMTVRPAPLLVNFIGAGGRILIRQWRADLNFSASNALNWNDAFHAILFRSGKSPGIN